MSNRLEVEFADENNRSGKGVLDKFPDVCPQCHHKISPTRAIGFYNSKCAYSSNALEVIFRCPNLDCHEVFIGYYSGSGDKSSFYFKESKPQKYKERDFSETIKGISYEFPRIYNQALSAENASLDQVCGVGYRKSLEFLTKDYLLKQIEDEGEKEKVKNEQLGASIKKSYKRLKH